MSEIEKTCENCEHELEDAESRYCIHCIHNAIENFEPKTMKMSEKEIRNKAIDDFRSAILQKFTEEERNGNYRFYACELKQGIADLGEQLKGGA